jgi:hypothetical protein
MAFQLASTPREACPLAHSLPADAAPDAVAALEGIDAGNSLVCSLPAEVREGYPFAWSRLVLCSTVEASLKLALDGCAAVNSPVIWLYEVRKKFDAKGQLSA